jgi:hypothetical protein
MGSLCANLFEVQQFLHPELSELLKDGVAMLSAGDLSKQYENFQKFDDSLPSISVDRF